jgi:hypothetical protein
MCALLIERGALFGVVRVELVVVPIIAVGDPHRRLGKVGVFATVVESMARAIAIALAHGLAGPIALAGVLCCCHRS